MSNCFYNCIFKLLNIKFDCDNFNVINNKLEKIGLFAFQHRALARLLSFAFKIKNFKFSPPCLKSCLVENETRGIKYNLRNKKRIIQDGARTTAGQNTFKYVFPRLFNNFMLNKFDLKLSHFSNSVFNNINLIFDKSILLFDKLNISFKNYFIT